MSNVVRDKKFNELTTLEVLDLACNEFLIVD